MENRDENERLSNEHDVEAGEISSSSNLSLGFPTEIMDSNGQSLQPGQCYLSIGYDTGSGFSTHYIPISSTDFNSIISNEQELGNISTTGEMNEYPQFAEHTYSAGAPTTGVFTTASADFGAECASPSLPKAQNLLAKLKSKARKRDQTRKPRDETKVWDSNRTLTLLHLMREHESNFKQHESRQRIEVWNSIAEEMRKFGYVDATKLTCAKKWYNIKKKYQELSYLKSGDRKWYCYKEVKYLIPVMKRSRELPFTHPSSHLVTSAARKESLKSVKRFMEAVSVQNQELLDKLEFFRAEKEALNQEQEGYLEEITKSLQERSERLQYLNPSESESANHISPSPTTELITSCNEIRNLLPTEVEMVELVDGENIITTTSTSGEPIQLTVCLDWNQVNL